MKISDTVVHSAENDDNYKYVSLQYTSKAIVDIYSKSSDNDHIITGIMSEIRRLIFKSIKIKKNIDITIFKNDVVKSSLDIIQYCVTKILYDRPDNDNSSSKIIYAIRSILDIIIGDDDLVTPMIDNDIFEFVNYFTDTFTKNSK